MAKDGINIKRYVLVLKEKVIILSPESSGLKCFVSREICNLSQY